MHSTYFDTDQKRYRFAKTKKSEEFKFLYILEELSKESKKVLALPIAKEGEFVGFNTEAEARKIEEILNRENV